MRAVFVLLALSTGCAAALSEARPAHVVGGGEVEASIAQNVVVPPRAVRDVVGPAREVARALRDGRDVSEAAKESLVRSGLLLVLSGPGYGAHLEVSYGLGAGFDASARVANGGFALGARRALPCGDLDCSLGLRLGYDVGDTIIPFVGEIADLVDVAGFRRLDAQGFLHLGQRLGDTLRWWAGLKAVRSDYRLRLDARAVTLGAYELDGVLAYYGGTLGAALGWRYAFLGVELSALWTRGSTRVLGERLDLGGLVLAPSLVLLIAWR